jgi:methyltransferase family protein
MPKPPPSGPSRVINSSGDILIPVPGGRGGEIGAQRFDELDRRCLTYALSVREGSALDLGAGHGLQSLRLALADLPTTAIDIQDLASRYESLTATVAGIRLGFVRRDLKDLSPEDVPERLNVVYSQRTLHYLRFHDAVRVLRALASKLLPTARFFISVSGINSPLGEGYSAAKTPLGARFGELETSMGNLHGIQEPVCLYSEDDMALLASAADLKVQEIWSSDFKNIKGIFSFA